MDLSKSITKILNFSFIDSLKNKNMQKYLAIIFLINVLFFIIYLFISNQLINGLFSTEVIFENIVLKIFELIQFVILFSIPFTIILTFFEYKIIQESLKINKIKSEDITLISFIKFLFLPLIIFICALISIFNIKLLAIGIISILLFFIGLIIIFFNSFIGAMIILISFLTGLTYFFIVIWQMIRLSLSPAILIEGKGIKNGLSVSWEKTKNNVLNIIIIWIVFFVIIYVVSLIFTIPSIIYSGIYSIMNMGNVTMETNLIFDPIHNLLLLPIMFISGYILIVQNCVLVNIYTLLKKKK